MSSSDQQVRQIIHLSLCELKEFIDRKQRLTNFSDTRAIFDKMLNELFEWLNNVLEEGYLDKQGDMGGNIGDAHIIIEIGSFDLADLEHTRMSFDIRI